MQESLVARLVDPTGGAALRLEDAQRSEGRVVSGRLVSETNGKSYPIVDGVPRFVEGATYADSFGMQWNRFREVQIDSATGQRDSERRFDTETRWTAADLEGRSVLDVGCGAGRFAEVAAARGAALVAVDYTSAVDAAKRTVAKYPNAEVVQASVFALPFRPGSFDFAYCIGVIQHTPDPKAAVANVIRMVRPGGKFSFAIYARRPWTKLNAKYLLRPLTKRLPQQTLLRAIEAAMPVLFPVTDRLFRVPVLGRVAQFAIPVATYVDRDEFTREQRYREAILDTFDMLAPAYDLPMTAEEVEEVFRAEGVRRWSFTSRVPIVVTGER